jgi:hypothetical protein
MRTMLELGHKCGNQQVSKIKAMNTMNKIKKHEKKSRNHRENNAQKTVA